MEWRLLTVSLFYTLSNALEKLALREYIECDFSTSLITNTLPPSSFVCRCGGISPSDVPLVADVLPRGLVNLFVT